MIVLSLGESEYILQRTMKVFQEHLDESQKIRRTIPCHAVALPKLLERIQKLQHMRLFVCFRIDLGHEIEDLEA